MRGGGHRKHAVRGADQPTPEGERGRGPGGRLEGVDEPGRADDVRDGVPRPDLVEGDVLHRNAVHLGLRLREHGEDGRRPLRDRAGESALAEPRPDVREAAMGVVVAVRVFVVSIPVLVAVVVPGRSGTPAAAFLRGFRVRMGMRAVMGDVDMARTVALPASGSGGGVETSPTEDAVCERLGAHGDDIVQTGLREPRCERIRALGEGVEEGGGEHVAGHPADRIQVNVHPPDSTPLP